MCRDAIKKAVELLKAATSAAGTPSRSAELLTSLSSLEEQLQAVPTEILPAVLEGMHSGVIPSQHLLLFIQCPTHTDLFMIIYMFSI